MAAPTGPKLNPQAEIQKQAAITQANSAADAATITRIETQIQNSPMGWLQAQFGEVNSRAASEQGAINSKVAESKDLVAKNQKDAPPDAGPPPPPGPAVKAAVQQPSSAGGGGKGAAPTAKTGGGGAPAGDKKVAAKPVQKGTGKAQTGPSMGSLASQMGGAANDAQVDQMLNAFTPKSPQPTEMLGRIKQMQQVAEGFRGKLDTYVAQGGAVEQALASSANFLGVGKDASAIWATNPYRQMGGTLGTIMTGLSGLKSATSLVGSICGKLGLILTVVGLLGMIFPPIGAAVSGVARILNVVGLICDAISFVISAILTGLNGVVLAKQIAAGASAEEKAATAELMMSEANDAASGFINLAMMFGPKFMKGLTAGSKGVINSLIRRFKAVVGRITMRLSGNVKGFANRLVRRLGFGGARASRVAGAWKDTGFLAKSKEWVKNTKVAKLYNSAPKVIDKVQDKLMKKYGNTGWAKKLDRVGAWSGSVAKKWDIEEKVGNWGENLGKKVGGAGANTAFGKSMAAGADSAEKEVRELAMKQAQRDAMDLEQRRWQNHLRERAAKQQKDGMDGLSPEAQAKFAQKQAQKTGDTIEKDFLKDEHGRKARIAKEEKDALKEKAREDKYSNDYYENKNGFRDKQMEKLHKSREKRWRLEEKDKVRDQRRKELEGLSSRTPAQEKELKKLNSQLTELDAARKTNLKREADIQKISGQKATEVHNWHDIATNVQGAANPVLEMLHLRENKKGWELAELAALKKPMKLVKDQTKWDKEKAKSGAASRGGASSYADIKNDAERAQRADFAAFVARGRPTASTAQTVRSMLSSINIAPARPQAAPQPQAPVAAPAPAPSPTPAPTVTPTPAPATPTAAAVSSMTSATPAAPKSATPSPTPAPTAAPTPSPAPQSPAQTVGLPAPVPEADEGGGGEALPYWPSLIPEFDKAMNDFGFMRNVASEFKKAQITGKQKAVDTLAAYGRYNEYAKLRQDQAKKHQTDSQTTKANTQENQSAAGNSSSSANQGEAKQNEAKGAANNRAAVDLPEPETRGFWGRILGAVKSWAKNKAAQIFGWIQEKIASVILKGLCGVTMGDLKEYGAALRRQQQAAGNVAGNAVNRAGQAGQESIKLGQGASKEAQGAADAIGECDRNITEADQFVADVTSFEQQLTQEKAHAQAFIGQVHAAVAAERQRKQQEEQQRQQEEAAAQQQAQQQAQGDGDAGATPDAGVVAGVPTPTPTPDSADADSDDDGMPDNAEAQAAKAQIDAAADYVKDTAARMEVQAKGRADDYENELALALTNRTGADAQGEDLKGPAKREAKKILEDFKEVVTTTKQEMDQARAAQVSPSNARSIADQVIATAETLDAQYEGSLDKLDDLFQRTYNGIRDGERDMRTTIMGDGTFLGEANEDATEATMRGYEAAVPVANTVADTVLAPFQATPATQPAAPPTPQPAP